MDVPRQRRPGYVASLAVLAATILIGGWLIRPGAIPQSAAPVPSLTDLEQLTRRAERRSLEEMTQYFATTAREVEASLARVSGPGMTAIAWSNDQVVSGPLRTAMGRGPLRIATRTEQMTVPPDVWGPQLPFSQFAMAHRMTPIHRRMGPLRPGDWLLAVWRTDTETPFAIGNFHQVDTVRCGLTDARVIASSVPLTAAMTGGGLFDVDGNFIGIILPCGQRVVAVSDASLQALRVLASTPAQRILGRLGLVLDTTSAEEAAYFKVPEGVLVREVWDGTPADAAGLRPGDILTHLNGTAMTRADDARPLAEAAGTPFDLRVQRGRGTLTVSLAPTAALSGDDAPAGTTGVTLASDPATPEIESVPPEGRAAAAGLLRGDRLVRINQADPPPPSQVRRLLGDNASSPVWLEVARDTRRIGVLLR